MVRDVRTTPHLHVADALAQHVQVVGAPEQFLNRAQLR